MQGVSPSVDLVTYPPHEPAGLEFVDEGHHPARLYAEALGELGIAPYQLGLTAHGCLRKRCGARPQHAGQALAEPLAELAGHRSECVERALTGKLKREELEAAVSTAHERGVKVRAHIASKRGILMALDAGMDVIDHGDEVILRGWCETMGRRRISLGECRGAILPAGQ